MLFTASEEARKLARSTSAAEFRVGLKSGALEHGEEIRPVRCRGAAAARGLTFSMKTRLTNRPRSYPSSERLSSFRGRLN